MKKHIPSAVLSNTPAPNEGIEPPISEKISVSSKTTEADSLAQLPEAAQRQLRQGITQAYLSQLNRYALENGLISPEMYRKMEISFKAKEMQTFSPFES